MLEDMYVPSSFKHASHPKVVPFTKHPAQDDEKLNLVNNDEHT